MMPKAAHDHRSTLGCRLVGLEWRLGDMLRGSTLQIDWASYLNSKFDTARRDVNYLFLTAYPRHRAYMARSRPALLRDGCWRSARHAGALPTLAGVSDRRGVARVLGIYA